MEKYTEEEIVQNVINGLAERTDALMLEGLSLHGYTFETIEEALVFAHRFCSVVEDGKVKYFYVKDVPFLVIDYDFRMPEFTTLHADGLPQSFGSYSFISKD